MAGPIIGGAVDTAAGILRSVYRRALGAQVGPFAVYRTDGMATGGEARRWLACSSLIDGEEDATRLGGRYVYIADGDHAGFQTRIVSTGYEGDLGYVRVTRPFPDALAPGTTFEISRDLPCEPYLDVLGLNQLVNQALDRTTIEYRLALTGNGTRSVSLADEGYIDQDDRIDAIFDTTAMLVGSPLEPSPYGARIDTSGATRTLVTDYTYIADQPFEVRILRRGSTLVKSGGAWGSSSVGLASDAQAAAVPVAWVVAAGMGKALDARAALIRQDERLSRQEKADRLVEIERDSRYWRAAFARIVRDQFPQPTPRRRPARPLPVATVISPRSVS